MRVEGIFRAKPWSVRATARGFVRNVLRTVVDETLLVRTSPIGQKGSGMSVVFYGLCVVAAGLVYVVGTAPSENNPEGPSKKEKQWFAAFLLVVLAALFGVLGITPIQKGQVGVRSLFGRIDYDTHLSEGLHWIPLQYSVTRVDAFQRHYVDVGTREAMETVVCKDEKQVEVDLTFGFAQNPKYAARLLRHFEPEQLDALALTAARAATRAVFIGIPAKEVYGGKGDLVTNLTREFEERLTLQLKGLEAFEDLSEEEMKTVFSILPVQAENILPPQRVRVAMNENQSAEIERDRQATLTEVQQEISKRMEKEGEGFQNLIKGFPSGTSLSDAAMLIEAVANLKRAGAVTQAVQEGKIPVIYLDSAGRSSIPAMGKKAAE